MTPEEIVLLIHIMVGFGVFVILCHRDIRLGRHRWNAPQFNPMDYLLSKMPEDVYVFKQPFSLALTWLFTSVGVVGMGWVLVNVPELYQIATVYILMALIAGFVAMFEYAIPIQSELVAAIGLGYNRWVEQILVGVVIALPFIFVNSLFIVEGGTFELSLFKELETVPVAAFLFTVLIVPLVEEGIFRGVFAPTVAKELGIIPAVFLVSLFFAIYHAYVYQWTVALFLYAFSFSVLATLAALYYCSILPGWVAHTLVNLSTMLFFMGSYMAW